MKDMKRILSLLMAMLMASCLYAQVNVVNAEGDVCKDGGVIDFHSETTIIAPMIPPIISLPSPTLVNTTDKEVSVALDVNIRQLPEGTTFKDCFSGVCVNYKEKGTHTTATKTIPAKGELETQIEWDCQNASKVYVEGTCIVDFTLYVDGKKSMTFTARYIHGEADGIKGIAKPSATTGATYTLDGKLVRGNAKGVVIRNGRKVVLR